MWTMLLKRRLWRLVIAFLFCTASSSAGYSQLVEYRCKLVMADFNTDNATTLGAFKVDAAKQGYIRKTFRLPTTDLYVNSAVFLKGERGLRSDERPTSMYLMLAVGRKEYSRLELEMKDPEVRTNAMTHGYLTGTRNLAVSTTFLGRPEPVILTLECRN